MLYVDDNFIIAIGFETYPQTNDVDSGLGVDISSKKNSGWDFCEFKK
jgi:hypothetical protein